MYILSVIQVTRLSEYTDNDLSLLSACIISSLSLLFNIDITNYHYFYQLVLSLVTTTLIIKFIMKEKVVIMANRTIDEENIKIGSLYEVSLIAMLIFIQNKIPTKEFLPR